MIEVFVVCEGQAEERFVTDVVAPALWPRDISVEPRLIATSKTAKGGALLRDRVIRYLRNTLRERGDTYVTTFFDLYGLKPNFPGVSDSSTVRDPLKRARLIESALDTETIAAAGCREDRFLGHIQPYEFEAVLFSDVQAFPAVESQWQPFVRNLEDARGGVESPEHINDGPDTHPSARLRILKPKFEKVLYGTRIADRIGLETIRVECKHFDAWVSRLESLEPLRGSA
jgi:hypothetical protein